MLANQQHVCVCVLLTPAETNIVEGNLTELQTRNLAGKVQLTHTHLCQIPPSAEGMTPLNHPFRFPFEGTPGFIPTVPFAPARSGSASLFLPGLLLLRCTLLRLRETNRRSAGRVVLFCLSSVGMNDGLSQKGATRECVQELRFPNAPETKRATGIPSGIGQTFKQSGTPVKSPAGF